MPNKILIVDDEPFNLDLLEQELTDRGYSVERAGDGAQALGKFESFRPDLVLLDYQMPDMNGVDVLRELRSRGNEAPVVMITAYGTIERAVQAMKEGAYDFLPKPFEPDHLALVVGKALEREKLRREVELLSEEASERYRLAVGKSAKMDAVVEAAKKAAASKATVLLLGESGTGKELLARAIHNWSERKEKPFVAINCVGLSRELLESDLFGHERGAFTGAHQLKKGKLELADGGTVLLDEVGDISAEVQTKLLRFLQEREFERVGGTRPMRVDVKIIAATNRDLDGAVREGRFREDLYYRLNVVPIRLPPLRERREDIQEVAEFFLRRFADETKKSFTGITAEAREKLLAYQWPGNVRELANVIERAIVLGQGPEIAVRDLPDTLIAAEQKGSPQGLGYHEAIEAHRRELVVAALAEAQGNRAAAAKALGLHRTHLMKLIKSLGIE
ncbi:MAG: Fis family transcriptional regulator [Deltaproteobacteria bacterium RIFCSPLOWO2_12_FULL_60_19]|nr:MAG: Fis family transcriptional regulator [Deltaproteobacteria bacterium RIFCSPLOWO2_12_FULL_60_19]